MDKNTVFGLLAVGLILLAFSLYTSNQSKKQVEARRIADSIARAEGRLTEPEQPLMTVTDFGENETQTEITHTADSIKRLRMGDFLVDAETGTEEFHTYANDLMEITFSNKGAHVSGVKLKDFSKFGEDEPLEMYVPGSSYFEMGLYLTNNNYYINSGDYFFTHAGSETIMLSDNRQAERIMFRLNVDSVSFIQYAYTILSNDYMVDLDISFVNMQQTLSNQMPSLMFAWGNAVPQQERGFENENNHSTIAFRSPGSDSIDDIGRSTGNRSENVKGSIQWIAQRQLFFTTTLIARDNFQNADMGFETFAAGSGNLKKFHAEANIAFDRNKSDYGLQFYFGPIKYSILKKYDMKLERLVGLGWKIIRWVNTGLVIPAFNFLSKNLANMGLIIFLLTLMVKTLILPLTYKSYLSMAKMRVLKPEIDAISAKYPNQEDAMKKQQATMALYKQAGVSPLGGCLPTLIQMPFIMALFFFFPTAIELRGQSFLWAEDLSTYDSILNLPFSIPMYGAHISLFALLMAVALFINTKLNQQTQTSGPGAGAMKFMMYLMPVMLLVWFNNYASGLTYYYLVSTLITIGQTYAMKLAVDDQKLHNQMKANAVKVQSKSAKKPKKGKTKWQARYEEMMRQQQQAAKQKRK